MKKKISKAVVVYVFDEVLDCIPEELSDLETYFGEKEPQEKPLKSAA
jgi:hypothetical protein